MRSWVYFIFMAACMTVTAVRSAPSQPLKPIPRLPGSESSNSGSPKSVSLVNENKLIFELEGVKVQAKALLWKTVYEGKRAGRVFEMVYRVANYWERVKNRDLLKDEEFRDRLSQLANDFNSLDGTLSNQKSFLLSKEQFDKLTTEMGLLKSESEELLRNDKNNAKIKHLRDKAISSLERWWKEPRAKLHTQNAAGHWPILFKSDAEYTEWLYEYEALEEAYAKREKGYQDEVKDMRENLEKLKKVGITGQG